MYLKTTTIQSCITTYCFDAWNPFFIFDQYTNIIQIGEYIWQFFSSPLKENIWVIVQNITHTYTQTKKGDKEKWGKQEKMRKQAENLIYENTHISMV